MAKLTGNRKRSTGTGTAARAIGDVTEGARQAASSGTHIAVIPRLKDGALSLDVGPAAIAAMVKSDQDRGNIDKLNREIESRDFTALSMLTQGIVKAANADSQITLGAIFGEDKKAKEALYDQLMIAIGVKEVRITGEGAKARETVVFASAVKPYFPMAGEDKDSAEYKQKNTYRTNFYHSFKKCIQAGVTIQERKIKTQFDKDSGTLRISGPAVKKHFGHDNVLLNGKDKFDVSVGRGKKEVTLNSKPSFTELGRTAASDHGKTVQTRSDSRASVTSQTPEELVANVCKSLTSILSKLKLPLGEAVTKTLTSMRDNLDTFLE